MRRVALEEFEGLAESYDRSVLATSGIAHYCSSSDWILAAHLHMHQGCPTEIYIEDSHWIVFARGDLYGLGQALHPMESAWCFACPLIGKEPKRMVRMLGRLLSSEDRLRGFVVLGGIPLGSRLHGLLKKEIGTIQESHDVSRDRLCPGESHGWTRAIPHAGVHHDSGPNRKPVKRGCPHVALSSR